MTLTSAFIVLTVWLVLVSPIVYFGVPLGASRGSVTAQEAIAVALAGIITVEFVELLFGWISAVRGVLVPLAWVGVIKHLCPVTWPTAAGIGILSWGISAIVIGVLLLI